MKRAERDRLEERLRFNVLFEDLPDELYGRARARLRRVEADAGAVILQDGSEGELLYLIADGRVRITKPVEGEEPRTVALLHAGDVFGELELVDGRPRSATVTAEDPCTLFTLDREGLDELVRTSHAFTRRLLVVLSLRLRTMTNTFIRELRAGADSHAAELANLERLIEAAKNVNSTLELDRVLTIVVDTAIGIVGCESGTLYLVDPGKKEIWSKVLRESRLMEVRLPLGKGIAGYVAATGDTLNIRDAYLDPRFNPEYDLASGFRTRTMLCMPMRNPSGAIIGVLQLLNKRQGEFQRGDESFINALSVHAAIAIENARLHEAERRLVRMQEEVRLAARIQLELLPPAAPPMPGYALAGRTLPAHSVGGDYYDFIPTDDGRMAVVIGDVSGKGLPAALLMANLQATLRGQTMIGGSAALTLRRANALLFRSTGSERFVTLCYALIDPLAHTITVCNAGHESPLLFGGSGEPASPAAGGPPLSILEEFPYEEETTEFPAGALLVLTTDGVTEAMNATGEQYGAERLLACLSRHREAVPEEVIGSLLADVAAHVSGAPRHDDITIVAVKRLE